MRPHGYNTKVRCGQQPIFPPHFIRQNSAQDPKLVRALLRSLIAGMPTNKDESEENPSASVPTQTFQWHNPSGIANLLDLDLCTASVEAGARETRLYPQLREEAEEEGRMSQQVPPVLRKDLFPSPSGRRVGTANQPANPSSLPPLTTTDRLTSATTCSPPYKSCLTLVDIDVSTTNTYTIFESKLLWGSDTSAAPAVTIARVTIT
ncbi:hypothetical protein BT96DRAFT_1017632 [Gymnopus androsaceus JB14]|uniref:Uncharacterized protein n=1 Tax=Gymnopus androsaceus JB14 TaxID=1447944 RepID=A0A6A4HWQ1_9AGAR|nr:hypothetical protein BT96DRAFT_1017632 [Gymnopus androsaceus JB14]